MMAPNADNEFRPTASLDALRLRALVVRAVREFFASRGYLEVDTPLLSRDVCVDAWIEPIAVSLPGESREWYLQTSPEFAMKRLLAAGAEALFQITRSFRQGESGPLHNREFSMLEWYRGGDQPADQMALIEELIGAAYAAAGNCAAPRPPFEKLTYDELFERFAGEPVIGRPVRDLQALAAQHDVSAPSGIGDDPDDWLNLLLASVIEPSLRQMPALFVTNYPASQAALARLDPNNPQVAERFELYLHGIEICNGYHELTNADELRQRFERQNERRVSAGLQPLPVESGLLAAMEAGLPDCTGVALGLDRLIMLAAGLSNIAQVIAFPDERT